MVLCFMSLPAKNCVLNILWTGPDNRSFCCSGLGRLSPGVARLKIGWGDDDHHDGGDVVIIPHVCLFHKLSL